MSFQTGNFNLTNGQTTYTFNFTTAFAAPPDTVIAVVENTSADATKLLIKAEVTAKSSTGFSILLDTAPNSNNYVLTVIAGTADALFAAITAYGKRLTNYKAYTGALKDQDAFPFVSQSPLPTTYMLTVAMLRSLFLQRADQTPASPAAAGSPLTFWVDDDYLYVRSGSYWGRLGIATSSWGISDKALKKQSGSFSCTQQQVQTITFPVEFSSKPVVRWNLRNETDSEIMILSGLTTNVTTAGFKVTLSTAPDTINYVIDYEAEAAQ